MSCKWRYFALFASVLAAVGILVCVFVCRVFAARCELRSKSRVETPVRLALDEIRADMAARRYGIADFKLELLSRCWNDFSGSGGEFGNLMPLFRAIDKNGGRRRESVGPRLAEKFGVPLLVRGEIRGGDPRRKAYDARQRFILIHTVNGENVEPERITLPLAAMNSGTLGKLSSLPVGTRVMFTGFESVRDQGFPDFPGEMSIQHTGYGLVNVFVAHDGGAMLDIYEFDCGERYCVNGKEYSADGLSAFLETSPVKWVVLYLDKRSAPEDNENLRRFRALCDRLGKVLEVSCQRSTRYDD